jgi:hypothetical protein
LPYHAETSHAATRSYLRLETGELGNGNSAYVSFLHQDQRGADPAAWAAKPTP